MFTEVLALLPQTISILTYTWVQFRKYECRKPSRLIGLMTQLTRLRVLQLPEDSTRIEYLIYESSPRIFLNVGYD